jgi:(5-formylfuran-3-yl)methyl phosphate synthase
VTRFLASVASLAEARVALAGGADIIDCKDPARGALGALTPDVVRAIVGDMRGKKPVSAVTGDLPMQPDAVASAARAMAGCGVDFIKIGLFPDEGRIACIKALAPLAAKHRIIGVLFADRAPDMTLLPLLAANGFAGVMIDTAGKGAGRLLKHLDVPALAAFVKACRVQKLMCGLAGSLEPPDVPRLLALAPDFLGFRGALCKGGRGGALDAGALAVIRALIPQGDVAVAPDALQDETDCVFVADFIAPMRIGAYAHEKLAPQAVRFNVEVDVVRAVQGDDMRGVFSYDLITDGITLLAATEVFALVETAAERVAEMALAHPRARRVRVKAEKMDLGPHRVGVKIERMKMDRRSPAG